jgi:hypothetical protein
LARGSDNRFTGYHRSALMKILDKVFSEKDIQGPIESDTQLLFEAGEFRCVLNPGRSPPLREESA